MKLNFNILIPFLCLIIQGEVRSENTSNKVNATNATENQSVVSPATQVVSGGVTQGNQVTITEEQLDNFNGYGVPGFRLAIIGDSGAESRAREVMELTSFDALLHLGDYDYSCKPNLYFDKMISDRKFQFMGIMGNHEDEAQCGPGIPQKYLELLYNEMNDKKKNSEVQCEFSPSKFMWTCKYKNMRIVGLTSGISKADDRKDQLAFLKKHLGNAEEPWKVCCWHYYDKYYHTGKYPSHSNKNIISGNNEDDESFYDYCKDQGAIIFSAHDHVYARTHVMSKFKTPEIDKFDGAENGNVVQIRHGATLNILNGAGGWEMYIEQGKEKDYSHWQKKYAKGENNENEKKYGGLFCDFNYKGDVNKAFCRFLRTHSSEKVFDSFYIYRNEDPGNVSYTQMDVTFRDEKIKAYKIANNIKDDTQFLPGSGNGSEGDNDGASNFKNLGEKIFNTRNIIIGGSVTAALALVVGGLFIVKKRKKIDIKDSNLLNKSLKEKEAIVFYNNYNGNNNNNNNYNTLPMNSLGPIMMLGQNSTTKDNYSPIFNSSNGDYNRYSDKFIQNLTLNNSNNNNNNSSNLGRDDVPLVNNYSSESRYQSQSRYPLQSRYQSERSQNYNESYQSRGRSESQGQSYQSRGRSESQGQSYQSRGRSESQGQRQRQRESRGRSQSRGQGQDQDYYRYRSRSRSQGRSAYESNSRKIDNRTPSMRYNQNQNNNNNIQFSSMARSNKNTYDYDNNTYYSYNKYQ